MSLLYDISEVVNLFMLPFSLVWGLAFFFVLHPPAFPLRFFLISSVALESSLNTLTVPFVLFGGAFRAAEKFMLLIWLLSANSVLSCVIFI